MFSFVRMGACGLLSLLLRLLQTGSDDEKNQAASGLWILSFRDENRALLRDEPTFFDGKCRDEPTFFDGTCRDERTFFDGKSRDEPMCFDGMLLRNMTNALACQGRTEYRTIVTIEIQQNF